jgi:WD40 repeat protein
VLLSAPTRADQSTTSPTYEAVDKIFAAHCLDCHAGKDPDGELVLESYDALSKGGEAGPAFVAHNSKGSLLIRMVEGQFEKEGKTKIMPPGKRAKLTVGEIAVLKSWIDSGAPAPSGAIARVLTVAEIKPRSNPANPINSLAYCPRPNLLAVARYGCAELRDGKSMKIIRELKAGPGNVNRVGFSPDGKLLFGAGGQPGWEGLVWIWDVASGSVSGTLRGHKDAIYAMALSPDGKTLATGGYDQKIKLWDIATRKELKTISGHNGCVYDLSFRADGKILASASADRTVKLWDTVTGDRCDTFPQSQKEVYAVAFAADGKHLFGAGVDNRLRFWKVSESARETTNPLLASIFAHEGSILRLFISDDGEALVSTADDRTVKVWDPSRPKEKLVLPRQSDWVTAAAFLPRDRVVLGRLNGTMSIYDLNSGSELIASTGSAESVVEHANAK